MIATKILQWKISIPMIQPGYDMIELGYDSWFQSLFSSLSKMAIIHIPLREVSFCPSEYDDNYTSLHYWEESVTLSV